MYIVQHLVKAVLDEENLKLENLLTKAQEIIDKSWSEWLTKLLTLMSWTLINVINGLRIQKQDRKKLKIEYFFKNIS